MNTKTFRTAFAVLTALFISTYSANSQTLNKDFYDTFEDNQLEWSSPPAAKFTFANKSLLFENNDDNLSSTWQQFDIKPGGSVISVWTTHSSGATDFPYGLNFGGSDYENEYFFFISADGYFKIGKFEKGEWGEIVPWTASDVIFGGQNARNHLKIKIRSTWEFYINSVLVHSIPALPLFGGNAGLMVEGVQSVYFEGFLVANFKQGIITNEFTAKFAALVDDFKNEFANSIGEPIRNPDDDTSLFANLFREWQIKDPLPEFVDQTFFTFGKKCFRATYGSYDTRDKAMSAFLKLQDWINYMRTDAMLWDPGAKTGEDGVYSYNQWLALDVVTGESGPYADIIVSLKIHPPEGSQKTWDVAIQLLHLEKKTDN